jgi:hypothetical protein
MAINRLYRVITPSATHLIEAPSAARAVAHVVQKEIMVDIPTSTEVFRLAKMGVEIESITAPAAAPSEVQASEVVVEPVPFTAE